MPTKSTKNKKSASKKLFRRPLTGLLVLAALVVSATSAFTVANINALMAVSPPTGLRASVLSHEKVSLNWLPSTSTPTPSYNIFRDGVQIGVMNVWISLDGSITYTDTSVSAGKTYQYYVQAHNANGMASSNTVTATTPSAPTAAQLGTVKGTITDKKKKPIAGATVSIVYYGQSNKVTTATNGSYTLSGVPVGNYTMSVTAPGSVSATKKITVVGGGTTLANFVLRQR